MFNKTHIGQQVSDPRFGNGVITDFKEGLSYPVIVEFTNRDETNYKVDGVYLLDQLPTLQFGQLDNWERRTQPQVQHGQFIEVLVSDTWRIARVEYLDGRPIFYYSASPEGIRVYEPLKNYNWRCVS